MSQPSSNQSLLLAVLIVLLAGLNVYQYLSRPDGTTPQNTIAPEDRPKAVIDRFHELYYDNQKETIEKSLWLGVQTWQNPNDVWIHQEIITEIKPDFIVECGTHAGGSACIWAMVLQQVNPDGRVITIDIDDERMRTGGVEKIPIWKKSCDFLHGSSTDPKIVEEVTKRVKDKKVMVILDSLHTKDHVLAELKAYSPLVSVGSYLIVQDTNINGHPVYKTFGPGPYEAVEEFLVGNRNFESVPRGERLLFTMHPTGYLQRRR